MVAARRLERSCGVSELVVLVDSGGSNTPRIRCFRYALQRRAIPEGDVERLAAVRAAVGPEIMLRADANQGYTPKEAIRLCRMCERRDLGLELQVQPVPKWDLAGMAEVRAAVDVLIEADEAAYTPHDVVQIIRAQAADVINIKIAKACTSPRRSRRSPKPLAWSA